MKLVTSVTVCLFIYFFFFGGGGGGGEKFLCDSTGHTIAV